MPPKFDAFNTMPAKWAGPSPPEWHPSSAIHTHTWSSSTIHMQKSKFQQPARNFSHASPVSKCAILILPLPIVVLKENKVPRGIPARPDRPPPKEKLPDFASSDVVAITCQKTSRPCSAPGPGAPELNHPLTIHSRFSEGIIWGR